MRKVSRTSTETRRPSWVGTSLTGMSNGISRIVTRCETAIHGGMMWLPGPIVRSMRPRRSRIAFEPSGTGTMNERNTPRNTSRTPTASRPPRRMSGMSRINPTMARTIPAIRNEFRMRFGADGSRTIGSRPAASGTPNASGASSSGTRAWVNWMYGGAAPAGGESEGGGGTACSVITSPRRRHRSIDGRHGRWRHGPPARRSPWRSAGRDPMAARRRAAAAPTAARGGSARC